MDTLYTFDYFWYKFHFVNRINKPGNKNEVEKLWNKCIIPSKHEKAIKEITKCNLSAKEYLLIKLK